MDRNDILESARHCINGHRAQDYGQAENNFSRIARLWEAYTGREYTPEQVAVMLALLKIARLGSGRPHPDNYIDLAGYAALAGELAGQAAPEPVEPVEERAGGPRRELLRELARQAEARLEDPEIRGALEILRRRALEMRGAMWVALARTAREPAGDDEGPNACRDRGCPACPLAGGCGNYGRHPAPQAVGDARSPQEPANGPGGAGAFTDCSPLEAIKIKAEKPESGPEGVEAGAYQVPPESIRFYALPDPEASLPGGALDLVEPLADLMRAVERARGELARQGLQLLARYEIHRRREPADGEGAD